MKNQGFRRNEPLDIRNYALAALEIANITLDPVEKKPKVRRKRRTRKSGIGGEI